MDVTQALQIVSRTDPGMVRSHNEDAVIANPLRGFVVLADGMGGYNAGEVASGMATTLLGSELEKAFAQRPPQQRVDGGKLWAHAVLEAEIARANGAIYQAAQSQPQYAGMGTTLVVARVPRQHADRGAHRRFAPLPPARRRVPGRSRATIRCCRSRSTAA